MNYRLDIQYDGSRYGGWQRQKDTDNTIQGKIEDVLTKMLGTEVQIQGAGRTDAGYMPKVRWRISMRTVKRAAKKFVNI